MKTKIRFFERGQSVVLVSVLMIAFIAILAFVIDGGLAYMQRRQAQVAADAGALAGARELCLGNVDIADDRAQEYACDLNGADPPPDTIIDVNVAGKKVTVTSSITFQTFFARLLGQPEMTAKAVASAGCFAPCLGEGVLPVVWICKPKAEGSDPDKPACEDLPIDLPTLEKYRDQPETLPECVEQFGPKGKKSVGYACPELTIVMDNLDIDFSQCASQGGVIDCDYDNDGKDDYVSSENRGWADLDGNVNASYSCPPTSEGSSELTDWILNGYSCPLEIHTWVGDQSGAATNIYGAVEERITVKKKPIVILPVFDDSCPGDPQTTCPTKWHSGAGKHPPDDLTHVFTSAPNYYHVIRFAAFYITCVQTNQHNDACPGAMAFYNQNEAYFKGGGFDDPISGNKYQTIEGYFIKGYIPGLEGKCGDDLSTGVYTLYLDQ